MQKKRIAIIGGGGAGSVAAWALDSIHDVTLFEKEAHLGGHAFTFCIPEKDEELHADLGVELFTEKHAPNLCALLEHFEVKTYVAPLSFQALFSGDSQYWNNIGQQGNIWQEVKHECNRFHEQMHHVMHLGGGEAKGKTLGDFLSEHHYTDKFIYGVLLPLLTTFSGCHAPMLEYSLTYTALSFNLGLLSFYQPGYWRKAQGGIQTYLKQIKTSLNGNVKTSFKIEKVRREKKQVVIFYHGNQQDFFDEVIFATHADQALTLIENPTDAEKAILGGFEYIPVRSTLHQDKSILSNQYKQGIYCEYVGKSLSAQPILDGHLTRVMNELEPYQGLADPLLVTFDAKQTIDENLILCEKYWKLPKLRPVDLLNKVKMRNIQGKHRIWYCGTDTTVTGHEGAILSGLVIANALGASYPFAENPWAKIQFDLVKGLMGVTSYKDKVIGKLSDSIAHIAKISKLEEQFVARTLLKMYI